MTAVPADSPLLIAARAWYDAGYCVVPSHEDGGKRPFGPWKSYQGSRPDWQDVEGWLATGRFTGIGAIMGNPSHNTELIEIEGPDTAAAAALERLRNLASERDCLPLLNRVFSGCLIRSAGDGLHLFIRITDGTALGNTKLAMSASGKVLAETRGEGGFVIVAPTPGRTGHRDGAVYAFIGSSNPARTAEVTAAERDELHHLFRDALNEAPAVPDPVRPSMERSRLDTHGEVSPFDDYRAKVTWADILTPAGWTYSHSDGTRDYWVRPGKSVSEGISASTIEDGPLVNFSTSVDWPTDIGLSKPQVYARLHHGGDLSAATRALRDTGYGDPLPARPDLPAWHMPEQGQAEAPVLPDEERDLHALAVARKYAELKVLEDARGLLATAKAGAAPELAGIVLHDFLDQPDAPLAYRVDALWPAEGRVLLAAAAKSGKTTMVAANLLPSLVDGREFLGRHAAQRVDGRVVLLNMEVGENTLRRWMREAGIVNTAAVSVANLRGKASALTLATEAGRERLAAFLRSHEAEVVILDPLAPVLASLGLDENSNADVAQFFAWWSEALYLAGVTDDLVVHHAGHAGQRSRGASRLLDEPDAVWTLTREGDDDTGEFSRLDPVRYLSAFGRDVEMAPEALAFNPVDKSLILTGQGKAEMKASKVVEAIREALSDGSAMSRSAICDAVGGKRQRVWDAVEKLVRNGDLVTHNKGRTYVWPDAVEVSS